MPPRPYNNCKTYSILERVTTEDNLGTIKETWVQLPDSENIKGNHYPAPPSESEPEREGLLKPTKRHDCFLYDCAFTFSTELHRLLYGSTHLAIEEISNWSKYKRLSLLEVAAIPVQAWQGPTQPPSGVPAHTHPWTDIIGERFVHNQTIPSATWTINHNLGYIPDVTLFTVGGAEFEADIVSTTTQSIVTLLTPQAGFAVVD
jgi:hypothetical protein